MRVLLADDSSLILDMLHLMLRKFKGIDIVASLTNGTDTLDALRLLKPDLAIIDNKMPGINGIEVVKLFRQENTSSKFIIFSFYANDAIRQLALESGSDYFFSKGDEFEKVQEVVAELLAIELRQTANQMIEF
jgi:DNA-binding NarL/FixJ family response regulator